jgi:hypothetical protein
MKLLSLKQNTFNFFAILILFLIVLARGLPAFTPGMTFSMPAGDGISTMAWMNEIIQTYLEFGFTKVMTPIDLIVPTGSGGELTTPNTFYHFWKLIFIGLAPYLTLDDIYDLIPLIGIFITGLVTYLLSLSFKISRIAALVVALFAISFENIDRRLIGHMFLSFWLGPLLMLWLVKNWVKKPRYFIALLLAGSIVLSFVQCEYYTYFGGIFACAFGLTHLFNQWTFAKQNQKLLHEFKSKFQLKSVLPQVSLSLVVLIGLMFLLFPSLIQPYDQEITYKVRGISEFNLYSLRNPAALFAPGVEFLKDFVPYHRLGVKGEMTFRMGIFFWVGLIYLLKTAWSSFTNMEMTSIKALAIAGLVSLLFTFTPNSFPWFSKITLNLFPMFRVGVRSLLFTNMAAILVLGVALTAIFRSHKGKTLWISILVTFFAFWDVQYPERGLFGAYKIYPLPPSHLTLQTLKAAPPGWVLEIPMWSNKDVFEFDSDQNYRRIQHGKKLINIVRGHQNSPYTIKINALTKVVNGLDSELINFSRQVGVQYLLVASYMDTQDLSPYLQSGELQLMTQDDKFMLYQLNSPMTFSKENFITYLNSLAADFDPK